MPPGGGFSIPLGEAVVNITAALDGLDRDLNMARSKTGQAMKKIGQAATRAGAVITKAITLPVIAIGTAAVRAAVKFDTSMRKITALVGISTRQVNAWRKEVLAMSTAVGRGPGELAEGLFFVASAGQRGQAALDILRESAKAAASGLGETKTVADAVTSAVNAYGVANLSAAFATDVLVATVREGKAEASALASVFGRILPIASKLGVRFDEVGAALAAMTRLGTSADESATALTSVLNGLLAPSEGAAKALASYELSAEGLRRQIREKGLLSTLLALSAAVGDNDEQMAKIFPNIRALLAVFSLTGASAEINVGIFERMADAIGSNNRAFEETAKGPGFKFQKALAGIQSLLIELGDAILPKLLPKLREVTEAVSEMSKAWARLSPEQQDSRLQWVALAAVAGPLLLVIGKVVTVAAELQIGMAATGTTFAALAATSGPIAATIAILGTLLFSMHQIISASEDLSDALGDLERLDPLGLAQAGRGSAAAKVIGDLEKQLRAIPKSAKEARKAMTDLVLDAKIAQQTNRFEGKGLGLFGGQIEEFEARAVKVRALTRDELERLNEMKLDAMERSAVAELEVARQSARDKATAEVEEFTRATAIAAGMKAFARGEDTLGGTALFTPEEDFLLEFAARAAAMRRLKERRLEDLEAETLAFEQAILDREAIEFASIDRVAAKRAEQQRTLFGAGFADTIQKMQDGIGQLGVIGSRVASSLVQGLGGALANITLGIEKGSDAFKSFARSFIAQVVTMIAQAAILALLTSIFSFGASAEIGNAAFAATLFGPLGNGVPGAAAGGAFTVPGAKSGVDTSLMMLRVTPGEEVRVHNRSAAQAGGGDRMGGGTELIVVEAPPGAKPVVQEDVVDGMRRRTVRFVVEDLQNGGEIDRQLQDSHGLRRRGNV